MSVALGQRNSRDSPLRQTTPQGLRLQRGVLPQQGLLLHGIGRPPAMRMLHGECCMTHWCHLEAHPMVYEHLPAENRTHMALMDMGVCLKIW